jgi:hypothetical protein
MTNLLRIRMISFVPMRWLYELILAWRAHPMHDHHAWLLGRPSFPLSHRDKNRFRCFTISLLSTMWPLQSSNQLWCPLPPFSKLKNFSAVSFVCLFGRDKSLDMMALTYSRLLGCSRVVYVYRTLVGTHVPVYCEQITKGDLYGSITYLPPTCSPVILLASISY